MDISEGLLGLGYTEIEYSRLPTMEKPKLVQVYQWFSMEKPEQLLERLRENDKVEGKRQEFSTPLIT